MTLLLRSAPRGARHRLLFRAVRAGDVPEPSPPLPGPGATENDRYLLFNAAAGDHLAGDALMGATDEIGLAMLVRWTGYDGPHAALFDCGHSFHCTMRGSSENRTRVWPKVGDSFANRELSDSVAHGLFETGDRLVVINIANGLQQLFVDNELRAQRSVAGSLTWDDGTVTRIFAKTDGGVADWFLGGRLWWMLWLSRPFTEAERNALYNDGSPQLIDPETGVLGRYPIIEGEGEVVHDTSGNGRHFAVIGAAWVDASDEPAPQPPQEAPANLQGDPADDIITWTWQQVQGATGYRIEHGPVGGSKTITDVGNVLGYDDTQLNPEAAYDARVWGYNSAGEGPKSAFVQVTTLAEPPAPDPGQPGVDDSPLGTWAPASIPAAGFNPFLHSSYGVGPQPAPDPAALPGSYTEVSNAAQLHAALAQPASSHPNRTIVLRAGIYQGRFMVDNGGSSGNELIIRKHPGDAGEAIIFNGYTAFRDAGNNAWELHNAAQHLWRSVGTGFGSGFAWGAFEDAGTGKKQYLYPYLDLGEMTGSNYRGPGLVRDGGRVYLRLQDPDQARAQGVFQLLQGKDPRQHRLWIGDDPQGFDSWALEVRTSHVRVWDIRIQGVRNAVGITGNRTNVRFLRSRLYTGQIACFLRNGNISNVWFEWCQFRNFMSQNFAREDHKSSNSTRRAITDTVALGGPHSGETRDNVHQRHCRITGFQDNMRFSDASGCTNSSIKNCFIQVVDDATQNSHRSTNFEAAYNYVQGAGWGVNLNGGDGPAHGTSYYHHNIVDLRWRMLWLYGQPRATPAFTITHHAAGVGQGWPMAIYNNTIIGGGARPLNNNNQAMRINYLTRNDHNRTGKLHYVLNNIIIQTDWNGPHHCLIDMRSRGQETNSLTQGQSHPVEFFDHNCYWHINPGGNSLFRWMRIHPADQSAADYGTLSAWRSGGGARLSNTQAYGPHSQGWEAGGQQGNPDFMNWAGGDLRPAPGGRAATMAHLDLTQQSFASNWPDRDSAYVGALAPAA